MPVRSSGSSIVRWPDRDTVDRAVREWAGRLAARRAEVCRVGYFGSYARGNWGVGSDLDVVLVLARSDEPFERRAAAYDTGQIPVPVDLLVYTADEWRTMSSENPFGRTIARDVVWVFQATGSHNPS